MNLLEISPILNSNTNFKKADLKHLAEKKRPTVPSALNWKMQILSDDFFQPSFQGHATNVKRFSNLLDEALINPLKCSPSALEDMSNLFKNIFAYVLKSPEHLINIGRNNNVYLINDRYVLRSHYRFNDEYYDYNNIDDFKLISNNSVTDNLKTYFGAKKAQCAGRGISILRNADPDKTAIPLGCPYERRSFFYERKDNENKYKESINKLSEVPQESFDEVAEDIKNLEGMSPQQYFDYENPNNFLLVHNKIKIVDDLESEKDLGQNNLFSMLKALLVNKRPNFPAIYDDNLVPYRQSIFKKSIISGEKYNLSLDGFESDIVNAALHISGYNRKEALMTKLQEFRKEIPEMGKRLIAVRQYLESIN